MTKTPPLPAPATASLGLAAETEANGLRHGHSVRRRRSWRFWASRWLPAAFVTIFIVTVLSFYGVSASDMALFTAYVTLGLTLPGLLLIRAIYHGERTLAEEMALGITLGYAIEVITYIAARALGAPLLVVVWPIATYVLFLSIPQLRRYWRGSSNRDEAPAWASWSLALIVAFLVAWSAVAFFRAHALTWPALGSAWVDMPFHLALIGELKHHMPPMVPMVDGEPLLYHWFAYAHLAAASWVTGVEPVVLLFRLGMLPVLIALVILLGMTGRRVMRSWTGGLMAVAGTISVAAPSLYLGANPNFTWGGIQDTAWGSPTQTFGALLFAPVVLLLIDLLEHRRRDAGRWLLLGIFLVTIMGAKAVYLPLLAGGLVAVAAVEMARRRPFWPALTALGMTMACLLFAQFALFGNIRQGMVVHPLSLMRITWGELTGLGDETSPLSVSVLGFTLLYLLCWGITWCGVLGLLSRPQLLMRPGVILSLGIGAAGLGAALLLGHAGLSQLWFLRGSYPYLVIAAVYGTLVVLKRARVSLGATACAVGGGVIAAYLIPIVCGVKVPLGPDQTETALYRPYITLLVVVVLISVVLLLTGMRKLRVCALMISMIAAIGLPAAGHARVLSLVGNDVENGLRKVAAEVIPPDALTVGRWLRAHSDPDDLVATNVHCRWGYETPCDSRQFWMAALTERHVLVEGWAYTSTNLSSWRPGREFQYFPFWDNERIQLNDEVFRAPSSVVIQRLRERFGLRWLVVDERRTTTSSRIEDFAELRLRSGDYAVYRVPDGPVS